MRQHHDLDRIPKRADETLVVYLADKMVQGDREVTLEERFAGSLGKCVGNPEAMKHFERRRRPGAPGVAGLGAGVAACV